MNEPMTHEHFLPYVGRGFSFAGHPVTLTLASVNASPHFAPPGAARVPFSLILHGPATSVLPEGHYQASIEDGPDVTFHIMPIHTTTRGRQDYQVVFN